MERSCVGETEVSVSRNIHTIRIGVSGFGCERSGSLVGKISAAALVWICDERGIPGVTPGIDDSADVDVCLTPALRGLLFCPVEFWRLKYLYCLFFERIVSTFNRRNIDKITHDTRPRPFASFRISTTFSLILSRVCVKSTEVTKFLCEWTGRRNVAGKQKRRRRSM